jgi:tetratricopeptide (TPR) repeat protein
MIKNWLRGKKVVQKEQPEPQTVDELVALGRPEDARLLLEGKLRTKPRDRRYQVKLGDVFLALRRPTEALEMYEAAAQGYAGDGFHDKSRAVLQRILKIAPQHEKAILGLEQLDRAKERERRRKIVLRHLQAAGEGSMDSMAAFQINQLWKGLSRSSALEALDTRNLGRLFEHLRLRVVKLDVDIVDSGDELEELFLVASGTVEVITRRAGQAPIVLRTYESGDVFGEGALLEHRLWEACHRAASECRLLCLDRQSLAAALTGLEDPRSFLDALRTQRHDASLAAMIRTAGETN